VFVLEKHGDFLRDFRGDTIHPSTIQIMQELGLAEQLLQLLHTEAPAFQARTQQGLLTIADFSRLKTRWPYLIFLPQWDFLNFLTDKARQYPGFHLMMNAEARELIEEDERFPPSCGHDLNPLWLFSAFIRVQVFERSHVMDFDFVRHAGCPALFTCLG
jgi:2-polyprenyl-6-methoxyphenol hydroxylase-like FAD-dependent oxidoreductase